eukprot:5610229-Prymnesium_polylepis.1
MASEDPSRVAGQLRHGSKRWSRAARKAKEEMLKFRGQWESDACPKACDCPDGCTHYIVTDCMDVDDRTGKVIWNHSKPVDQLSGNLMSGFAKELPSITFSTMNFLFHSVRTHKAHALASTVGRGLPLLLIDSRKQVAERPKTVEAALQVLRELEADLERTGRVNTYAASTLAFLHSAFKRQVSDEGENSLASSASSPKLRTIAMAIEEWKVRNADIADDDFGA